MTKSSEKKRREYSAEEKLQAISDLEKFGETQAAEKWSLSPSTLYWWRKRRDDGEDLAPKPKGAHAHKTKRRKRDKAADLEHEDPIAEAFQSAGTSLARTGRPRGRAGEQISLLPARGDTLSANEEIRRLQRENHKLKRVIASLLDE